MNTNNYTRRVARYLLCKKSTKTEIIRQIQSDIDIALQQGEALPQILAKMGSPKELAAEFNENFDVSQKRAVKRQKRCVIAGSITVVLLLLAALLWWLLPKTYDIDNSDIFSKTVIQAQTSQVIDVFSANDYGALNSIFNETMKKTVSEDTLKKAKNQLNANWGEYKSTGNMYIAELRQYGKDFAVVQVSVSYENVSVTYTLTFDKAMKLAGFYIK